MSGGKLPGRLSQERKPRLLIFPWSRPSFPRHGFPPV